MNTMQNGLKEMFKRGSMLTKLLFINIGVFIVVYIVAVFFPVVLDYLSVPANFHTLIYRPWTLVTYMFIHEGFMHLLMNMLWLWWFGKMFLTYFNDKQLAAVYLLGGFTGAFFHLGINYLLPTGQQAMILGASAAVMSVVFAVVAFKPNYVINLIFIGPVKIKYIGLVALLLDLMGLLGNLKGGVIASDGIAHIAHIGGSLYGLWFGFSIKKGKDITRSFNNFLNNIVSFFTSENKNRRKMKISRNEKFSKPKSDWDYNTDKHSTQKETDRILDKISKNGYDSLSKKEKDFLFKQKKN
ncbi:MAG: rhomboid family intramembrane serine protease [Bacteroidetes bacterium]|nr:MAG: rhomboid family intramembrane serine protease [Bacteroidota bacterium]